MQSKQASKKVSLPDLPSSEDTAIVKDNIRALGIIYYAAMFENLRVFDVADKLIESFMKGLLPVGRGRAGERLFKYWKESRLRISQADRRNLYQRVFGLPGGDESGIPNREFSDLWLRFISAVNAYIESDNASATLNQELVRKAGRDLAANLSLYGYGGAHFVAIELKKQIHDIIRILSTPEITTAYGARDAWQVIERISTRDLGGSANLVRYRTMASSGATIMAWLANNSQKLTRATGPVLKPGRATKSSSASRIGVKNTPTDSDLINSCEQWLSVAGVPDDKLDEF